VVSEPVGNTGSDVLDDEEEFDALEAVDDGTSVGRVSDGAVDEVGVGVGVLVAVLVGDFVGDLVGDLLGAGAVVDGDAELVDVAGRGADVDAVGAAEAGTAVLAKAAAANPATATAKARCTTSADHGKGKRSL
jgi:hypothetical protein